MVAIKHLVIQFRNAINAAKHAGEFQNDCSFRNFPRGCCGDTCVLLAQYLLEHGIRTVYVCGTYRDKISENIQSHAWLLTENKLILDITGDQFLHNPIFMNYCESVYIGPMDEFHKLFNIDKRDVHENIGIAYLGEICKPRLMKLYRKITEYL